MFCSSKPKLSLLTWTSSKICFLSIVQWASSPIKSINTVHARFGCWRWLGWFFSFPPRSSTFSTLPEPPTAKETIVQHVIFISSLINKIMDYHVITVQISAMKIHHCCLYFIQLELHITTATYNLRTWNCCKKRWNIRGWCHRWSSILTSTCLIDIVYGSKHSARHLWYKIWIREFWGAGSDVQPKHDKPARLIIRLLYGFVYDFSILQIVFLDIKK